MKIDWKRKLTSRKFWMAVALFVSGLMVAIGRDKSEAETVAGLIMQGAAVICYLLAETWTDVTSMNESVLLDFLPKDDKEEVKE